MGPVCCIEVLREGGPPVLEMCGEAVGSRAGMLRYIQACDSFFSNLASDGDQNDECDDVVRFTAWLSRGRIWLVSDNRPPTFQAASCRACSGDWNARVW